MKPIKILLYNSVPNLIHIYLQGVAVIESVHLRVFTFCLLFYIHDKKWNFTTK